MAVKLISRLLDRFTRITTSTKWMPEVDGLRFVAIAWVVLYHLQGSFVAKTHLTCGENSILYRIFLNGEQGVQLFFMISGFILCLPFARHYLLQKPKPDLLNYYVRRLTRIEPPYIIACITIALILGIRGRYGWDELLPHTGASLFYVHNIIYNDTSPINVVFWSLEIEVQFYILAPLLTLIYFSGGAVMRRLSVVAIVVVVPLLQPMISTWPVMLVDYINFFMVGIMICDIYVSGDLVFFNRGRWWPWLAFAGMVLTSSKESVGEAILLPVLMALLFLQVLAQPNVNSLFSTRWVAIIGGMCYSIYLIHFQIIAALGDYSMKFVIGDNFYINLLLQALMIVPVLMIISALFYRLIERPFMSIRFSNHKS